MFIQMHFAGKKRPYIVPQSRIDRHRHPRAPFFKSSATADPSPLTYSLRYLTLILSY
jgi:hypothetical protein